MTILLCLCISSLKSYRHQEVVHCTPLPTSVNKTQCLNYLLIQTNASFYREYIVYMLCTPYP